MEELIKVAYEMGRNIGLLEGYYKAKREEKNDITGNSK